jgi:hypothetical protein
MKDRLFYNLGWDYASHGMSIDESDVEEMRIGFHEGQVHFKGKTKPTDIYIRKWLQIRYNALKRSRHFDDEVTPVFLKHIVTPLCPVSRIRMTAGTLTDSDWSIDRIINDGGYSQKNLMVLATSVNQIKGSMSLTEIYERVKCPGIDTRLTHVEWSRMFSICQHVYDNAGLVPLGEFVLTPIVAHKPYHLGMNWEEIAQSILLHYVFIRKHGVKVMKYTNLPMQDWTSRLKKSCEDPVSKSLFHKLVSRMERRFASVQTMEDLMWDSTSFGLYTKLFMHQVFETNKWPLSLPSAKRTDLTQEHKTGFRRDIAFDTNGFLPLAK